jgi:hypothetical protein
MTVVNAGLAEVAKLTALGQGGTKFDEVAIGTGTTAAAATDTALQAEISSSGGNRKTAGDVTGSVVTTTLTNDTARWVASWTFTANFAVREFGVFNGSSMLLRQLFDNPFYVIAQDTLELTIDVKSSDQAQSAISRLTQIGFERANQMIVGDVSTTNGDRIAAIGLGRDNGTLLTLDVSNTDLGDEILVGDSLGLARAQETTGPTVSIVTTNVTGDTIRVQSTWDVTGTVSVQEAIMSNGTAQSTGIAFIRSVFNDPLNFVNTDRFTLQMNMVHVN